MTTLSRRSFLQGIMMAAGVAAAGIPLETIAAVPTLPPQIPVPTFERGDIWVRIRDSYELIGCASSIAVRKIPEKIQVSSLPFEIYSIDAVGEIDVDATIWCDGRGADLIYHVSARSDYSDFIVGADAATALKFSGFFRGYHSTLFPEDVNRMKAHYSFDASIKLSGQLEIITR